MKQRLSLGHYESDCVHAFDADGDCLANLPWIDASAFARAEEEAEHVLWNDFLAVIDVPEAVLDAIKGHETIGMRTEEDVYVIHDLDADVHHFFVDAPKLKLYRCEASIEGGRRPPFDSADWRHQSMRESGAWDAMGRWFASDPAMLTWYAEDVGEGFRIVSVEVDELRARAWRVDSISAALKFSRDPEHEYFVPRETAESAIVDEIMRTRVLESLPSARTPAPN